MTDEQYAAALAQYEKEVAAYETAAANDYSATDASVVWDGGGVRQATSLIRFL